MKHFPNFAQTFEHFLKVLFLTLFILAANLVYAQNTPEVKVDFNQSGRQEAEVNEEGYTSWFVAAATTTSMEIEGINFSFQNTGSGVGLKSNWHKASVQSPYYARLVGDVMFVEEGNSVDGNQITLTISGLSTGTHSILFYLNMVDNPTSFPDGIAPIDITINGELVEDDLEYPARVTSTYDAAVSYHTFSATAGNDVTIVFSSVTTAGSVYKNISLCGFELNTPNISAQASFPSPEDADLHFDADNGSATLKWKSAPSAVSHHLYFGTSESSINDATTESDFYIGEQTDTFKVVNNINLEDYYYWRVDEEDEGGNITTGNTWSFAARRLAFPDAEGHGRYARGGRGGKVVYVTNLNDSGAGSLREAVTSDIGPRTVVFAVSGVLQLESRLAINQSYITIAGQTAPGKGICIRSSPFGLSGSKDAIVQHMRVRLGAGPTADGMGMAGCDYSIIDHSSISWTIDEAFSSRNAKNITLQRTLISEALNDANHQNYPEGTKHGYAATIGGSIGSFHHNLLAHNYGRNWSMGGGLDGDGYYSGQLDIFNNVVYNWGSRATDGGAHEVNFVGNYYKKGAGTSQSTILKANLEGTGLGSQSYYYAGNVVENTNGSLACDGTDNTCSRTYTTSGGQVVDWEVFVDSPFFESEAKIDNAYQAYKSVLSDVGCNQPEFDDHDVRVLNETLNGTYTYSGSKTGISGMPDDEADVGGYEDYPALTRAADFDTDLDGMPDWWENANGFNTESAANDFSESNSDLDGDGYTNLEEYLHWMSNPHYFVNSGEELKISLRGMFKGFTSSPSFSTALAENCSVVIANDTAYITSSVCGLASATLSVIDSDDDGMSRTIGIYFETESPEECTSTGSTITIQENTTGFCSVDGTIDNNNAGYSGSGFANTTNAIGMGVDYQVIVGESGTYTFTFRYASSSDRPGDLIVNETTEIAGLNFPSTVEWTTWNTVIQELTLDAGTHDIRVEATTASGLGNIDYLQISGADVIAGTCSDGTVTHTLTVDVQGQGTVSIESGEYNYGDKVSITATPVEGWEFTGWSGNAAGLSNPIEITMNSDKNITANFSEIPESYMLTIGLEGNGTTSLSSGSHTVNEELSITATPEDGWQFDGWTGDVTSTDNPVIITMDTDKSIVANFSEIIIVSEYTLTVNSTGLGSTSITDTTVEAGTSVAVTATPSSGWSFDSWSGDASGSDNPLTVLMDADKTIIAKFVTEALSNSDQIPALEVYPNPVGNELVIKINRQKSPETNIYIYNSVGMKIKEFRNQSPGAIIVDTSDLMGGVYFIQFHDGDRDNQIKVIKN